MVANFGHPWFAVVRQREALKVQLSVALDI